MKNCTTQSTQNTGFLRMFEKGTPPSPWLSSINRPFTKVRGLAASLPNSRLTSSFVGVSFTTKYTTGKTTKRIARLMIGSPLFQPKVSINQAKITGNIIPEMLVALAAKPSANPKRRLNQRATKVLVAKRSGIEENPSGIPASHHIHFPSTKWKKTKPSIVMVAHMYKMVLTPKRSIRNPAPNATMAAVPDFTE